MGIIRPTKRPEYEQIRNVMKKELLRLRKKYLVPEDNRPLPKEIKEIY